MEGVDTDEPGGECGREREEPASDADYAKAILPLACVSVFKNKLFGARINLQLGALGASIYNQGRLMTPIKSRRRRRRWPAWNSRPSIRGANPTMYRS